MPQNWVIWDEHVHQTERVFKDATHSGSLEHPPPVIHTHANEVKSLFSSPNEGWYTKSLGAALPGLVGVNGADRSGLLEKHVADIRRASISM